MSDDYTTSSEALSKEEKKQWNEKEKSFSLVSLSTTLKIGMAWHQTRDLCTSNLRMRIQNPAQNAATGQAMNHRSTSHTRAKIGLLLEHILLLVTGFDEMLDSMRREAVVHPQRMIIFVDFHVRFGSWIFFEEREIERWEKERVVEVVGWMLWVTN